MNTEPNQQAGLDLWAEDLAVEELPEIASASTFASFSSAGSVSCPYSTLSSASCVGSA